MEAGFWQKRWEENAIGFHESEANALLVKHFNDLSLGTGDRIFVPLCGKTLAIHWLLSRGLRVAGAELSKIAVVQLFTELGVEPSISAAGELERYSANGIDIFVGDIFQLSRVMLGPVAAIFDRAALVALPEHMRKPYTEHQMEITDKVPQLLICFEYDQSSMEGPPFSISREEVSRHYGDSYKVKFLESTDVAGGLKNRVPAKESVWLLSHP